MASEQQQCQPGRTAGPTCPAVVCLHGPARRACDLAGTGSAPRAGSVDVAEMGLAVSPPCSWRDTWPKRSLWGREAECRGAGGRRSVGRLQYWESPGPRLPGGHPARVSSPTPPAMHSSSHQCSNPLPPGNMP